MEMNKMSKSLLLGKMLCKVHNIMFKCIFMQSSWLGVLESLRRVWSECFVGLRAIIMHVFLVPQSLSGGLLHFSRLHSVKLISQSPSDQEHFIF